MLCYIRIKVAQALLAKDVAFKESDEKEKTLKYDEVYELAMGTLDVTDVWPEPRLLSVAQAAAAVDELWIPNSDDEDGGFRAHERLLRWAGKYKENTWEKKNLATAAEYFFGGY
jgi:hypothetical protein